MVLGTLTLQAGSFSYVVKTHTMNLSDGKQIEILLQQEVTDEDLHYKLENKQAQLSREILSHEKMLQILNKVRKDEKEVNEELSI